MVHTQGNNPQDNFCELSEFLGTDYRNNLHPATLELVTKPLRCQTITEAPDNFNKNSRQQ